MAKGSKLSTALDAYRGRDYGLEKQKKLQKQAIKRRESNPELHNQIGVGGSINGGTSTNDEIHQSELESEGWESDEEESAMATTVC